MPPGRVVRRRSAHGGQRQEQKEVRLKLSKKLQGVLHRWNTTIRPQPSVVVHEVYAISTTVEPLMFAVYETAIKAIYALKQTEPPYELTDKTWETHLAESKQWYERIASQDGFELPEITADIDRKKCYTDWILCRNLIIRNGLYDRLLD
jgi:hypothetical protein